ncbi:uncharacterized protein LOC122947887 [Acropora millepora]|uniref:uncharacterized protein LOC122947887 n=1 Tax=Acropora millepora TaxID=45264 RepID=UPI001CF4201C|nr:uncharacterized protein LOC122947887 [Acropora millepora]
MDRDFKPPPELSLQGNPSENWRRWRQRFELYLTATESDSKEDDIKIARLLSAIGPEALERFNHFTWATGEDKAKYKDVMDKFQREFAGMKRVVFSRYQFWDCQRGEGQPFDEYLTNLRVLSRSCEFLEADNMIRDKIVFSTKEKTLKERLLRETDTSLQKVIDICRSAEITKKEIQSMQSVKCDTSSSTESNVHVIKSSPQNSPVIDTTKKQHEKCRRCGNPHAPRQCPAWGKICAKCNRPNQKEGFTK